MFACTFFPTMHSELQGVPTKVFRSTLWSYSCRIGRETKLSSSLLHGEQKENVSTCKSLSHIISIVLGITSQLFCHLLCKLFIDVLEAHFGIILFLILSKKENILTWTFGFFVFLNPGHSWFFTQSVTMLPLNVVFSTLSISYHSFMACKVSGKIQLIALWEFPYILLCFSLADSRILSSFVIFAILIMICLYVGVVGFILFWTLCVPFTWIFVFFFLFREILAVISSNLFLNPPPLLWSYDANVGTLEVIQRSLKLFSF